MRDLAITAFIGLLVGATIGNIYGQDKKQGEWDAAVLDAQKQIDVEENAVEVVTEDRAEKIETDKTNQRASDGVTWAQYNSLRREKENERITFTRELEKLRRDGLNTCINEPMPIQLQRRPLGGPSYDQ